MKKLSLFLALAMLLTVGGVYAVWTYTQSTDVMDITTSSVIDMTAATSIGTYGQYDFDNKLVMTVDPKEGTTHTTSLILEGTITITFTPNTFAPTEVKENGITSYFSHDLAVAPWQYDGKDIITLDNDAHTIGTVNSNEERKWTKNADGTFTYVIQAEDLAEHMILTEFVLDTKTEYDAYDDALAAGQIRFHISDGIKGTENP